MTDDDLNEVVCAIALRTDLHNDVGEVRMYRGDRIALFFPEVHYKTIVAFVGASGRWYVMADRSNHPILTRLFAMLGVTATPLHHDDTSNVTPYGDMWWNDR